MISIGQKYSDKLLTRRMWVTTVTRDFSSFDPFLLFLFLKEKMVAKRGELQRNTSFSFLKRRKDELDKAPVLSQ
jgi:hypothetical protein